MTNAQPESDFDRLRAQKNQKLGLILAVVVAGLMLIAYFARFILWHVVFKQ